MDSQELEKLRTEIATAALAAAKATHPLVELSKSIQANLQPMLDALAPTLHNIQEAHKRFAEAFGPVVQQYVELQATFAPLVRQIATAFDHLPDAQRRALQLLAADGWYLDPGLALKEVLDISDLFEHGELEKARMVLSDHFDSRVNEIEHDLVQRFPTRANLIKAAMRAHRNREFALSVPVFLAQADGVCAELIGVQLYARRDGHPMIAARLKLEERTPLMASVLSPLAAPTPISASAAERASVGDLLNRHAVLHGEATDYDNRTNSCRALSLLAYVAWVLEKITKPRTG